MPIRHATLHQLKVFHTLARHLSVSRAAEALHLTPSAVSIQVKQLAEFAGQPLLDQVGKRLYLTEAGKVVAAACEELFERMERLSQELAALQGEENGRVRLAIITTAKYFVPKLLGSFCARHPAIELSLFIGNREQLFERLKENRDDFYILGRPPAKMPVVAEAFAENRLVVVASPEHPLGKRKRINPERLRDEPFILREEGSGTRQATLEFFEKRKIELNVRMEMGSNEAIKQCVMAGLGIAVLSLNNLEQEIENGSITILDIKGLPLKRSWYVVHLRDKTLPPAAHAFRAFMMDEQHRP